MVFMENECSGLDKMWSQFSYGMYNPCNEIALNYTSTTDNVALCIVNTIDTMDFLTILDEETEIEF